MPAFYFRHGFSCLTRHKKQKHRFKNPMWNELIVALALLLILEGLFPFLNPMGFRRVLQMMANMDDQSLRTGSLVSMVLGVILLYLGNPLT